MAKAKEITDVGVGGSEHSSTYWLGCVYDGARYHVWINKATHQPDETTLYKNPPLGVEKGDPGHYWTRKLDLNGATGRMLLPAMLAARDAQGLVQKWRDELAVKAAEELRVAEEARKAERIEAAAPDLYAALEQIKRLGTEATQDPAEAGRIRAALVEIADKALAGVAAK